MTKTNIIKRLTAGFFTLAFVAGATPANVGGFLKQSTTIVASAKVIEVTDVLDANNITTSTSDTEWSGLKLYGATYAGKTTKNKNGPIIITATTVKNDVGIVSTSSGGKAKKVTVDWNGYNTKTLELYGKHTAYTDAQDLYSDKTSGDLIGSITSPKTELNLKNLESQYEYIGLRSSSGEIKLNSISITWEKNVATDISQATVDLAADNTVSSITVDDEAITNLSDFDITYGIDENHTSTTVPTEPGTYYAYVTPKNTNTDYTGTARSAEFVIEAQKPNIANATLTFDKMRVKYTGNEISATFTVKDGEKTLVEGTDFTVSGDIRATEVNNVEGYTVTITGINDYTGELTDKWYIDPLNTFNVSTVNGTVKTTMPVGGFKENQSVTVVGDGNITGYGWYEDNWLVSTKQTYQFYVSHDTNLIWKTLEETDAEKAILGTASINIGSQIDSDKKITLPILASWELPTDAKNVTATTYRYFTSGTEIVTAEYVIANGTPKILSVKKAKGAVTYNLNINKTGSNYGKHLYIVTVVTYNDSNNEPKTVISGLVSYL
ncbi:MAG: hypothetical protein K6F71_13055 [Ruminococcus sp.]|uniref:hypothetical protein n=1 Tax=Ruminococcus sp. TaxID=41978 RepID=UPI0025F7AC8D|nr:hypothetical protein [Ruminococcus sp.]MCR5541729.1 hypothetical protein [Ruminococcus sp.]